jgi:hypothetical protein
MTCVHLQELYDLCRQYDLKLGGSDLIRVVCHQCGRQEVCPSTLREQMADGPENEATGVAPDPSVKLS